VIGAGVGGLSAAIDLARSGCDVTVLERAATPGGKMREVAVGDQLIDAGPTVFTMRWVFEDLFRAAGASLESELDLHAAKVLARHAWVDGGQLDLFADIDESAAAIEQFAGPHDAAGFRAFCARSAEIYRTLRPSFIAAQRPSPLDLVNRVGWNRIGALWQTAPFSNLWSALGRHFHDPRLRQLFGRYATYCGSSPFAAPATLMLVAHVEQDGVWVVGGGMRRVADAMRRLGEKHGARVRFNAEVAGIIQSGGCVSAVELPSGERIAADAIVFNGDVGALASGTLGADMHRSARAPERAQRSLSAITWCLQAETPSFALEHHNVFFSNDYEREFSAIFGGREIAEEPTVYVCAQDRGPGRNVQTRGTERLLVLVNAPADGDLNSTTNELAARAADRAAAVMSRCGMEINLQSADCVATTPGGFNELFPGSGGALYGRANHGPFASFARSGARSAVRGLYLAGGSVHPGPGVPMATLSGRLAAAAVCHDIGITPPNIA
jgi:1-hydroxycarotenoid 3,4-desaturase